MEPVIILWAQPEARDGTIVERRGEGVGGEDVCEVKPVAFDPELLGERDGGITDHSAVCHDSCESSVVLLVDWTGSGLVMSDEKVLEAAVLFDVTGLKLVHVAPVELYKRADLGF